MRILKKQMVCGEEFIAAKITNKYHSFRCARFTHLKEYAENKKYARCAVRLDDFTSKQRAVLTMGCLQLYLQLLQQRPALCANLH